MPEEEREIIGVIIVSENSTSDWVTEGKDTDDDGILDINEAIGWNVTFTDAKGVHTIHVTSDPKSSDTDSDGVIDFEEWHWFINSSNPRSIDTDGEGLTDLVEIIWGYNPVSYDTDGDGLDDSKEITFGSDPLKVHSDDDGLSDYEEYVLGSDPKNNDTDFDGLNDSMEVVFKSSLIKPDTDNDQLFDLQEYNLSTDPRNPDTDNDTLRDGYEVIISTDPKNNDTDSDLLLDGKEIYWKTDPLDSDTDNDGLLDGEELDYGTNPLIDDTDNDGIIDSEDPDSYAAHVEHFILAHDDVDEYIDEFVNNLGLYTNVTTVSADELLMNYSNASYIVLVGRPDAGNGTVGNITANILADSNETLNKMLESEYDRFAVKYGVWNSTQTIVMLTYPYPFDHWRVLTMLKGKRETVLQDSVELEWPTPRDLIRADSENTIKRTDSMIWIALEEAVTPSIKITRYNASTTPSTLTSRYSIGTGQYLDIEVSENVQNDTGDIIKYALITMYYTASDLDRTGDGDANDPRDIDESKLKLYRFDEASSKWTKLNENMDWVFGTGVNTANVELHGKSYEGYVWANVSHLSLYGLGTEIESQSEGGYDILPMFDAVPELTFFKRIQLSAGVEEQVTVSNITGIYKLSLNYPENINLMLYLSNIKSLPSGVPEASENVYNYFELLYTKFKTNIKVNPVTQIDFKVPKDWAGSKDGITLMHYDNGWKPINTELTGEDANNYYFRVEVNSYGIFAIVQSPLKEAVQSQQITEAAQDTDIPSTSLQATENNPFILILSILALLIGLGVVSYLIKRKKM